MCTKVSEASLEVLSRCCRGLLRLDVFGCSMMSRQAVKEAGDVLVDCAIKSSHSDESDKGQWEAR
jgi:hypothetical protein